jgi:hypothetical protein
MKPKNSLTAAVLIALIALSSLSAIALAAQLNVGIKVGDYTEYAVSFTGTPWMGHDAKSARMDIVKVDGLKVDVNFTTVLTDGSVEKATENLDFETGRYIDYFVVSSGLSKGDIFYDSGIKANITINNQETRNYAGADRTVISGVVSFKMHDGSGTADTVWYWDQATGIAVEAQSTYPNFTMHTTLQKTNLWIPQTTQAGSFLIYGLVIAVAVLVSAAFLVISFRKRRKNKFSPNSAR